MATEFTQSVLRLFEQNGMAKPVVLSESENELNFGSADVTLQCNDLTLYILNDRGKKFVEVGLKLRNSDASSLHPVLRHFKDGLRQPTCPLEILAVAMGWVSCEHLVQHYDLAPQSTNALEENEAFSRTPILGLGEALEWLRDTQKRAQLVKACQDEELLKTAGDIEEGLQRRFEKLLTYPRVRHLK